MPCKFIVHINNKKEIMKSQSKIFQSPVMNCGKLIDWINLYYLFIYLLWQYYEKAGYSNHGERKCLT